jgi:hypothetical protein
MPQSYASRMRFVMRALVLLALPAVAFSWLLQVKFPDLRLPTDYGFIAFQPRDYLLEALTGALPYVAVLAVLAALAHLYAPKSVAAGD